MESLVSVIIPVYKVEKYIKECIESIINQTYKNLEIILVDDGSPDDSPKICDEYAKIDKRINVIHKQNTGVSDSRNVGLDKANGEYIIFCDSDDFFEPNGIEVLVSAIKLYKTDMAIGTMIFNNPTNKEFKKLDEDVKIIEVKNEQQFFENFSNTNLDFSSPCAKIYKKENLNNIRFKTDFIYGEDQLFNLEHYMAITKIAVINKNVYNYRIHGNSCVRQNFIKACDLREKLIPYQKSFCEKINNNKLMSFFCGEYLKDFVSGLYLRKVQNSKQDCKNYYKTKINQEEFKYCLKNSKHCGKKVKLTKFVLQTKIFGLSYMLSKFIYNKKFKHLNKNIK